MSKVTVQVENINVEFPKTKPFFGTIENSVLSALKLQSTEPEVFTALKNVSLKLRKGEIVGLIGKNGSGKSTLLRTISGIYRPDSGIVKSAGQVSLLARLGIGFNIHLTGRENVYLYGSILGHSKRKMDSMMEEIIDFSGLRKYINQPLRTYSSGMKTRLSFSVASAVKSEILLIDEVLSVGDIEFRERSNDRIKEMVDDAATVLIVSHNLKTLEQICDRIILIDGGRIKAIGEPKDIIEIYRTTSKVKTEPDSASEITKEVPKRSLVKKISHTINIFSLFILRLFGLTEWASSAVPATKVKKEGKKDLVHKHWGEIFEPVNNTDYMVGLETKKIRTFVEEENKKKMKLVILTCVWKRPRLTEIVLSYYSRLREEMKDFLDLELVAVGSEGKRSKDICEACGFHYHEHENQPMSEKWQYGLKMTQELDPDAVIIMGSDDLITREILEFYVEKIKQGHLLVGIKDFYIYESNLRKLAYWRGYGKLNDAHRMDETIGLGRCLTRPLLDKIDFQIWGGLNLNRNLDGAMTNRLKEIGIFPVAEEDALIVDVDGKLLHAGHIGYKLEDTKGLAIDIKTKTNVTNFERYVDRDPESVSFIDGRILSEHIYEDTIREIMDLNGTE